jgi:hypothetical protein
MIRLFFFFVTEQMSSMLLSNLRYEMGKSTRARKEKRASALVVCCVHTTGNYLASFAILLFFFLPV